MTKQFFSVISNSKIYLQKTLATIAVDSLKDGKELEAGNYFGGWQNYSWLDGKGVISFVCLTRFLLVVGVWASEFPQFCSCELYLLSSLVECANERTVCP